MNLHDLKHRSIVDYLAQLGYVPNLIRGVNHWYASPFRAEHSPSFKVNAARNQWYDFGTGQHGDIIDLICLLQHCSTAEAVQRLSAENPPSVSFGGISTPAARPTHKMELVSIKPLTHPKLFRYLSERGLKSSDVAPFVSEISYKISERNYFALGFPNDVGGWELRNPYFKGCLAPKGLSTIKGSGGAVAQLFEGFMDFLSWRKLHPEANTDSIVLNSLALLSKAIPKLQPYVSVECFLDNDEAGNLATQKLREAGLPIKDMRHCFAPCKDVNEYLIHQLQEQKITPIRKRGLHR